MENGCPLEVFDSESTTVALGLICLAAAGTAKAGGDMQQVLAEAKQAISSTYLLGLLDTLKYLVVGGRSGKAKKLLGSVLNVKPMLTIKDGEVVPAGQARTRAKGVGRLVEFVQNATDIEELAIGYNTTATAVQITDFDAHPNSEKGFDLRFLVFVGLIAMSLAGLRFFTGSKGRIS